MSMYFLESVWPFEKVLGRTAASSWVSHTSVTPIRCLSRDAMMNARVDKLTGLIGLESGLRGGFTR
jgi:hypothetical protein